MTKEEIKRIIPHREPMLLIDEAFVGEDGSAHGFASIHGKEWFLQGHFPDHPVVPGVILLEMMAQSCCVMLSHDIVGKTPYFTSLNAVKFKSPVIPGDRVEFICRLTRRKGPFAFARGEGFVDGKKCVEAELSFALKE